MLEETALDYALVRVFAGNLPYKRAGLRRYVSRSGSSIGSCCRLLPDDGLTGSNRVLVGLSRRFSNFPAAGVDRYELKVPLLENGKGTEWHLFARLLRCGRVGTHAVERRGPVGIALRSTSTAGFPALHLSATFRHGPLVAPGLESAVL